MHAFSHLPQFTQFVARTITNFETDAALPGTVFVWMWYRSNTGFATSHAVLGRSKHQTSLDQSVILRRRLSVLDELLDLLLVLSVRLLQLLLKRIEHRNELQLR